ncbi:threonylcarbamoyl-AMP synthase [Rhodobacteraceae bacterium 2376]|uniref:Threonylcarbamoyl-AMP synthase n=1 Tax=Rhabdonatronobacter sediminivivens TaxID=2743469 RepID=A0A7Z0KXK4_9RHOB|nr:L-threonylcarbamoyladenylate synthase [Rhabdonatronobacter sediminivivens]NYS23721.1 threonylcarbamoyl-AMP synthase [Rhabdonatronobacter sediminivivens]
MDRRTTQILPPDSAGIAAAATILREGGLVALPTETVYGLAADARNDRAVAAIFAAKDRPRFNPLIVHLAEIRDARALARFTPGAEAMAAAFWPGPLTLVLPLRAGHGLSPLVTAGLDTVALRLPAHPLARQLLQAFGGPLAAPSANPSGRISPTSAAHVMAGLTGRIDAVLDGGPCAVGVESTILDCSGDHPALLRAGGTTAEGIAALLGNAPARDPGKAQAPRAPGQLSSHYAPHAPVRLNVSDPAPDELWIGFGPGCDGAALTLSASGDLTEAAANLFRILHEADAHARPIAFAPVPQHGLGQAINDRLIRAAHPRPAT